MIYILARIGIIEERLAASILFDHYMDNCFLICDKDPVENLLNAHTVTDNDSLYILTKVDYNQKTLLDDLKAYTIVLFSNKPWGIPLLDYKDMNANSKIIFNYSNNTSLIRQVYNRISAGGMPMGYQLLSGFFEDNFYTMKAESRNKASYLLAHMLMLFGYDNLTHVIPKNPTREVYERGEFIYNYHFKPTVDTVSSKAFIPSLMSCYIFVYQKHTSIFEERHLKSLHNLEYICNVYYELGYWIYSLNGSVELPSSDIMLIKESGGERIYKNTFRSKNLLFID